MYIQLNIFVLYVDLLFYMHARKTVASETVNNVSCHSSVLVKITCARSIMTKNHPQSSIFMHLSP